MPGCLLEIPTCIILNNFMMPEGKYYYSYLKKKINLRLKDIQNFPKVIIKK